MKKTIIFALAAFIGIFAVSACFAQSAPSFSLRDLNGEEVSLSDFRGKTVILNFWATWCPPCRAELPDFDELAAELKNSKDAVLLTINLTDGRDTKSRVEKFVRENKFENLSVLLDNGSRVAGSYGISGIPTTFVIDANGDVAAKIVGMTTKDAVKNAAGIK